jgi:hypothetical protein
VALLISDFNLVVQFAQCDGILYNLPPVKPHDIPTYLWFRDTILSICLCRKVTIVFGIIAL